MASDAIRRTKTLRIVNAILTPLAVVLFLLSLAARIESYEEHMFLRVWDVAVGFMLAASFVLAREVKPVPLRATIIVALIIWLLASGLLLSLHEFQVYARTSMAEHGITRGRIVESYEALTAYSRDCGSFPSESRGLDALREAPGLAQWKGPYLPDEESIRDVWGRRFRYALRENRPIVWSCGKDGVSGTQDDIAVDEDHR